LTGRGSPLSSRRINRISERLASELFASSNFGFRAGISISKLKAERVCGRTAMLGRLAENSPAISFLRAFFVPF
jgi:hypothetical protein